MKWLRNIFTAKPRSTVNAPNDLDKDPRWARFNGHGTPCPCCGEAFTGVFDIHASHPDNWPHGPTKTHDDLFVVGNDVLGSDICCIDQQHYVRAVLYFPILGSDKIFGYGCWGSVSDATLQAYLDEARNEGTFNGGFSWLCNSIPTFSNAPENSLWACDLIGQGRENRPLMEAHDGPIAEAQAHGISFDQLLDIYEKSGQDIRPHLTDGHI